jgi:hypothetical protein
MIVKVCFVGFIISQFIALSSALPVVGKHSPLWLKTIHWIVFLTRRAR